MTVPSGRPGLPDAESTPEEYKQYLGEMCNVSIQPPVQDLVENRTIVGVSADLRNIQFSDGSGVSNSDPDARWIIELV
jgi:hypothetical protein